MEQNDFLLYEKFFEGYVGRFDSNDEIVQKNIVLKRDHTYRVVEHIESIGMYLNLSEEDLYIAKTIALFHDIGRFYQFSYYRTFNDRMSENHADLSVKVLKKEGILDRISTQDKALILNAIAYHNRYKLPFDLSKRDLILSQLIRDADKIDILKVLTDHYENIEIDDNPALELFLPDDEMYNPLIVKDLLNHKNSNHEKIQTKYDQKLAVLSWIFDINFKISLQMIKERHYIDKILKVLPDNEEMDRVRITIDRYIDKQIPRQADLIDVYKIKDTLENSNIPCTVGQAENLWPDLSADKILNAETIAAIQEVEERNPDNHPGFESVDDMLKKLL